MGTTESPLPCTVEHPKEMRRPASLKLVVMRVSYSRALEAYLLKSTLSNNMKSPFWALMRVCFVMLVASVSSSAAIP